MKRPALSAVLILCLAGATLPAVWTHDARAAAVPKAMLPSMEAGRYLPESTVMVRVADRVIRAEDVRLRYFDGGVENRPKSDSLGRVQFLSALVDKEVLGLMARKVNPPLEVEQRADMRRTTNAVLQNALYQTMVEDSLVITERDIEQAMPQFSRDVRVRELLFEERATAERIRASLVRGRMSWSDAFKNHSVLPDSGDGTLGWVRRVEASGEVALEVFSLPVGSISNVVQDQNGFHVFQALEHRPVSPLPLLPMRRMIIRDLRAQKTAPRVARMYQLARDRAGAVYDTTNLKWVAEEFRKDIKARRVPLGGVIAMNTRLPLFSPEDLQRTLVRDKNREFTLSAFLEGYKAIPPMIRRRILNMHTLQFYVDAMFLEPLLVAMAQERGADKDPRAVAHIEEHREKLMVERMVQDSVLSRVRVTDTDVRKHYEAHKSEYTTTLKVRYAAIMRHDEKGIDSVAAAMNAGSKPADIVAADRAAGSMSSVVADLEEGKPSPYAKILLEELRAGQSTRIGPDTQGKYLILTVLERQDARRRTFEEAEGEILEALRAEQGDRLLHEFLDRHRRRYPIEVHPERVMAIRFTDPILE